MYGEWVTNKRETSKPDEGTLHWLEREARLAVFDPTNIDTYTCDACGQEVYEELAADHDAYCGPGHVTVIGVVGGGSA